MARCSAATLSRSTLLLLHAAAAAAAAAHSSAPPNAVLLRGATKPGVYMPYLGLGTAGGGADNG